MFDGSSNSDSLIVEKVSPLIIFSKTSSMAWAGTARQYAQEIVLDLKH